MVAPLTEAEPIAGVDAFGRCEGVVLLAATDGIPSSGASAPITKEAFAGAGSARSVGSAMGMVSDRCSCRAAGGPSTRDVIW
jgi:hypothetical protein